MGTGTKFVIAQRLKIYQDISSENSIELLRISKTKYDFQTLCPEYLLSMLLKQIHLRARTRSEKTQVCYRRKHKGKWYLMYTGEQAFNLSTKEKKAVDLSEFQANRDYTVRPCLNKEQKNEDLKLGRMAQGSSH